MAPTRARDFARNQAEVRALSSTTSEPCKLSSGGHHVRTSESEGVKLLVFDGEPVQSVKLFQKSSNLEVEPLRGNGQVTSQVKLSKNGNTRE